MQQTDFWTQAKRWLKFTPKEQRGLWMMLGIFVLVWASPRLLRYLMPAPVATMPADSTWNKSSAAAPEYSGYAGSLSRPTGERYERKTNSSGQEVQLRSFDPNTADSTTWVQLGVRPAVAARILRYRAKGGRFRMAEDLRKIWGMPEQTATRLMPYVQLEPANKPAFQPPAPRFSIPARKPILTVNINEADSSAWEALPGIGPALARRIVLFRAKLGGFISVEQLREVYGIADSVFQRIRPQLQLTSTRVQQIAINTASQAELQGHPYIRFGLARQLVAYRQEHGPFRTAADLARMHGVPPETWEKLLPYLQFEATSNN